MYHSVLIVSVIYEHYIYSVISISDHVNRSVAKPVQLHLRPLKIRISPCIGQFERGRHSALYGREFTSQ